MKLEDLSPRQIAGLERLGKKAEKKRFYYDEKQRYAYTSGRADGILIGLGILSFVLWAVVVITEILGVK
jgi:hypothetical protein